MHLSSHSRVSAYSSFSEKFPSAPTTVSSSPLPFLKNVAPEIVVLTSSFKFVGSSTLLGLKLRLHLISITLFTLCPHGIDGVND